MPAVAFPADSLQQLWEQGAFVDVRVCSEDGQAFGCHRIILGAASTYFRRASLQNLALGRFSGCADPGNACRAQFHGPWAESSSQDMHIPFPGAAVGRVLHSIYTQQLDLQDERIVETLAVSDFLGVAAQKVVCCEVTACMWTAVAAPSSGLHVTTP